MKKRDALGGLLTPFGITQLLMLAAVGVALFLAYGPWRQTQMRDAVREQFPTVMGIESGMLAKWLAIRDAQQPVILDVRTQAEFDVSHLPSAVHTAPSATPTSLGFDGKLDTPFVVYCTVGFDSASYALSLLQRGYKRVQILDGGIYQWANEHRALEGKLGGGGLVRLGNNGYSSLLDLARRAP